jgi:hypothetical protein
VALRLALGSSRRRILRAVFTEAILISLAGGVVGSWEAWCCCGRLAHGSLFPHSPSIYR